ncbi:transposable element Tcb2 transposase [Trichonephila clavipes]|nr:transposable element Tcb2 transposase [Trichonephila clavipes]
MNVMATFSPDMNAIEHVWDALGRRVAGRQPTLQTIQELERALLEEWYRIPQLVINSLIDLHFHITYYVCRPCINQLKSFPATRST